MGLSAPGKGSATALTGAGQTVLAAAIQFEPQIGDVPENLRRAERLGRQAGEAGARLIVLPEFFSTGMAFAPAIRDEVLRTDGAPFVLLQCLARDYGAIVGGSFLCTDGQARNAFMLVAPDGLLGRHDKDLPTMWEHCFYVGGSDDGLIDAGARYGVAMCWEYMRRPTAQRLRGKVDCIVGGSAWWSVPDHPLRRVTAASRRRNARNAVHSVTTMARLVGAPVVHGALCGPISCALLGTPFGYEGRYEGGAMICDADGRVLARRPATDGDGVVLAEIIVQGRRPSEALPNRYWLHRRGAVAAIGWTQQRRYGQRWRARQDRVRPPSRLEVEA